LDVREMRGLQNLLYIAIQYINKANFCAQANIQGNIRQKLSSAESCLHKQTGCHPFCAMRAQVQYFLFAMPAHA
jgi:hypothetical protein